MRETDESETAEVDNLRFCLVDEVVARLEI